MTLHDEMNEVRRMNVCAECLDMFVSLSGRCLLTFREGHAYPRKPEGPSEDTAFSHWTSKDLSRRCDIQGLTTRFWSWALDLPHTIEDPESGLGGSGTLR